MQKMLPFVFNVRLKSYAFFSDYLGILEGNGIDTKPTLYNHFTTLIFGGRADFLNYLEGFPTGRKIRKRLKRKFVYRLPKDILTYVKTQIDNNNYVILVLNAKTLSSVTFDRDWYHEWFIHGYDDSTERFSAVGHDVDKSCHAFELKQIDIRYADLKQSLPPKTKRTELVWMPQNAMTEPLNLRKIKRDIFLYAYNLLPLIFNAAIYPKYSMLLRLWYGNNEEPFDLRGFKLLTEHKALMLQMMNDLVSNSQAAEQYKAIQAKTNAMLMTALKYNMTKKNKDRAIETICHILKQLRQNEPRVLRMFYRELIQLKNE